MPKASTMKLDDMMAEIERLRKANASMEKELKKKSPGITFKVSPKGAVSVYGLGRFPVTLYKTQWEQLLDKKEALIEFLEEHEGELKTKDTAAATNQNSDSSRSAKAPVKVTKGKGKGRKAPVSDSDSDSDSENDA